MPKNPKEVASKLETLISAWETLQPTKSFAGMTLEQFKDRVQPSLQTRTQLSTLRDQATQSRTLRFQHDSSSHDLVNRVVNAIKGDPDEGDDGPLYAALGYVPKSQRRSGLTRKGLTTSPVEPAAK